MRIQLFTLAALLMSGLTTLAQDSRPSFILQKDDLIRLDIRLATDKSAEVSFKMNETVAASFREFAELHAGKEVVIEVMKTKLSRFITQDLSETEVHTFTNVTPPEAVHLAEAFARMDFARTFKSLEAAQRIKLPSETPYALTTHTLSEAVRELREESVRHDPERKGVNLIVVRNAGAAQSDQAVSVEIHGRSVAEAARQIADAAGHVLSVEDHALVFRPRHSIPDLSRGE